MNVQNGVQYGQAFELVVSEVRDRLSLVRQVPMLSPLVRQCIRGNEGIAECGKLLVSQKHHPHILKPGYEIQIGSSVAVHCGHVACQMMALLNVVVHTDEMEVKAARRMYAKEPSAHGDSALRNLAGELNSLLSLITSNKEVDIERQCACLGRFHEPNCEELASHKLTLGKHSVVHCGCKSCIRYALLNVVLRVHDAQIDARRTDSDLAVA